MSPGGRGRGPRRKTGGWRSLSGQRDFSIVYGEGVKEVGRLFVLYLYPGDDLARAVVASRKVGGAVARNRAKRLLREAIRSRIERNPAAAAEIRRRRWEATTEAQGPTLGEDGPMPGGEGLWLVAVARRNILDADYHAVAAELDRLLDRPPAPSPGESG